MNKILTSSTAIAIIAAFVWLGFRLTAGTPQVRAAQCWDPGCCGPELVYNQWSCVSAEASDLCRNIGEDPTWVCEANGETDSDPVTCRGLCNGQECEWRCPISTWGKECKITSGSVRCSHPDDSTCTANVIAKQCQSQADVNDCYDYNGEPDVRECWVNGSGNPDPTPVPGSSCFGCSQPSGGFCMWYEGNCPSWGGNCNACQPQPEPPTPAYGWAGGGWCGISL
jgi:hypothetical protein